MKKTIKDEFNDLVLNFKLTKYMDMNESQTRLSFIDKFWKLLDWDVSDPDQVQIERTDRDSKRPDYRFMKRNKALFFVEAKKPSEDLKNPKHIYQTKLYCWNGNVPVAILTNFEQFRPFRSVGKPNINEAHRGIIKQFDLTFEEYPDHANELLKTFGREAVLAGSLDLLVNPTRIELRDTVDKDFLSTLSKWRTELATQISAKNKFENEFQLSEAVQRILDRLVFLRILQDREIEDEDFMCRISQNTNANAYPEFLKLCSELAPKYNGLIFNPHPISENLKIEGSLFKKIVTELDFEESPYRFDEIPVEMLGTIYERFLGDEINLDKKGKVVIDQKPEVRKAGGVYYTPQYIVEYIVENTVGKLLYGEQGSGDWERGTGTGKTNFRTQDPGPRPPCRTPDDVAKLKILDPACGSGSFLLGAFDLLIEWHEKYFSNNPLKTYEKIGKNSFTLAYLDEAKKTRLTARMKSRILKNNIFGVDIDKQATEVAQMSLYLKVLEGFSDEPQMRINTKETILPPLDKNILCGNSLIESDFAPQELFAKFSVRDKHKINPLDWTLKFPFINDTKGFDVVIGNPPWGADVVKDKNYFQNHYQNETPDSAAYFFEKAITLSLKFMGFIVPKTISYYSAWESIRNIIISNSQIEYILDVGLAFPEVNLESIVIIVNKKDKDVTPKIYKANPIKRPVIPKEITFEGNFDKELIKIANIIPFISLNQKESALLRKLSKNITVRDIAKNIFRSLYIPDADKVNFMKGKYKFINKVPDVKRYYIEKISFINLVNGQWIEKAKKIMVPRLFFKVLRGKRINCYPDVKGEFLTTEKLVNLIIDKEKYPVSEFFLAGIFNSKLPSYYIEKILFSDTTETSRVMDSIYLNFVPIPKINFKDKKEKSQHDRMVELVERMLKMHKELPTANEFDKKHIEQYIARTDKEIDALVYELYGLTEEEIKIVEGV
ncbi:MAG: fused endonuclease-methyltransferase [Ignavibacteria bacterium]|nr:fused endonuclease-methyltransferase [Ignavibacteria bacterium]